MKSWEFSSPISISYSSLQKEILFWPQVQGSFPNFKKTQLSQEGFEIEKAPGLGSKAVEVHMPWNTCTKMLEDNFSYYSLILSTLFFFRFTHLDHIKCARLCSLLLSYDPNSVIWTLYFLKLYLLELNPQNDGTKRWSSWKKMESLCFTFTVG